MLIFWAAGPMLCRDFFLKGFLKASRGYHLHSQQGFVRSSHFAVIFRSNFKQSPGALHGLFLSRRLSSVLVICTKGSARSRESCCSASCSGYLPYGEGV